MNLATPYTTTRPHRSTSRPIASPYGRAYWRGWDYAMDRATWHGIETSPARRAAFWAGYDMACAANVFNPH